MPVPIPLSLSPSPPTFQSRLFNSQQCLRHRCLPVKQSRLIRPSRLVRVRRMSPDSEHGDKSKLQARAVKDWLMEAVPKFGEDLQWRKALALSIAVFFVLDFTSAVFYAYSMNQELVVPVGLLGGCLLADLFKEIAQQVLHDANVKGTEWILPGLTSLFALVSLSSACFGLRTRIFLSHVGHGGLMQVFWMWWNSSNVDSGVDPESVSSFGAQES